MRKFKLSKLVRDNIVELNNKLGNKANFRVLSDSEYPEELRKKIIEEAKEINLSNIKETLKELADIQEAIDNLLRTLKTSKKELKTIQKQRNEKQGSFKKRHFIETMETVDEYWTNYYASKPKLFPEIKK